MYSARDEVIANAAACIFCCSGQLLSEAYLAVVPLTSQGVPHVETASAQFRNDGCVDHSAQQLELLG